MTKIRIITDSTADLPQEIAQHDQISVIPLSVLFGSNSYKDGIELTSDAFYQRLVHDPQSPTTSQPSPGDFAQAFDKLAQEGVEAVLVLTISSKLSGTFQAASMAKDMTNLPVAVIDSEQTSLGLGWLAKLAGEAANEGKSMDEIVALLTKLKEQVSTIFIVDTLEYLKRNGRIGKASALLGTLLNVKPILTLVEGTVTPLDKVRGAGKALERILEIVQERYGDSNKVRIGVMHAVSPEKAELLLSRLKEMFADVEAEFIVTQIGPVVGAHVGPGAVGLSIVKL